MDVTFRTAHLAARGEHWGNYLVEQRHQLEQRVVRQVLLRKDALRHVPRVLRCFVSQI